MLCDVYPLVCPPVVQDVLVRRSEKTTNHTVYSTRLQVRRQTIAKNRSWYTSTVIAYGYVDDVSNVCVKRVFRFNAQCNEGGCQVGGFQAANVRYTIAGGRRRSGALGSVSPGVVLHVCVRWVGWTEILVSAVCLSQSVCVCGWVAG